MVQRTQSFRFLLAPLLAAALLLAPALAPAGGGGATYVAEIEDLPLMPGLAEAVDAGMSFDKPEGRIVSAYAHGPVERRQVRRFYSDTLPQLGWSAGGGDTFTREGERLSLEFLGSDGDLTVRYTLQPR